MIFLGCERGEREDRGQTLFFVGACRLLWLWRSEAKETWTCRENCVTADLGSLKYRLFDELDGKRVGSIRDEDEDLHKK